MIHESMDLANRKGLDDKVLPSKGSSTHGSGKCRPCAWFWKPQGCQNDKECGYCHLCPEGELKNRKKSKVAAMRMGALVPAKTLAPIFWMCSTCQTLNNSGVSDFVSSGITRARTMAVLGF
ncbi:unnamed protein product [Durusdinium trenchii]|uniref:C3H1-type domain-containing protein n=1 Tax=Durusdinium trenchii TaxID=1381693 RepID=A0ABP0J8W1_9DINO